MNCKAFYALVACIAMAHGSSAMAGVFADDLSRCLVNSTTKENRADLIRWLFSVLTPPLSAR